MNGKNSQLADYRLNVRIKLAFLWATIIALYIYADYFELMTPYKLKSMLDLKSPFGQMTPETLIIFSILLIIPALLIPASILLKPILSKWFNIVFGFLYAAISAYIAFVNWGSEWLTFFVLYQFVELFVFFLIIRTAWTWPKETAI